MPVLQRVGNYIRNVASAVRGIPSGVTAGAIGFSGGGPLFLDAFHSKRPPAPYELVNSYKAIAYSCIRLNMHGVARTPLKLYARTSPKQRRPRRDYCRVASLAQERYIRSQPHLARSLGPDDAVDEIKEHPFLEALENPNPYFDYDLFIQHMVASLDVIGTSYFYPERPFGADGIEDVTQARPGMKLWPFQSQYVYPIKGMSIDDLLKEYRYFGDAYAPNVLIRIRYPSLRDPYLSAYSPLHACFEQAGLTDYYYAIVESILKVGARPSMMMSPKDANVPLGEAERRRIEVDMNNRFTGSRSGHIWVSNGALDVKELQFPPADLAGLKITENMRLLIANCFDVPISLLQAEDTNRAVASEGTHQHQYYAIEPRCKMIATALTKQLALPVDNRLFFCFDNPVDRDDEADAKIFGMKVADGRMTINEVRGEDGLEPVEWGDEPWLPQTLKQVSQLDELHEQSMKMQEQGLLQGDEQHDMAKEQHKDGLKTSDQSRKHADERLKMDAEDRAREAKDKETNRAIEGEKIGIARGWLDLDKEKLNTLKYNSRLRARSYRWAAKTRANAHIEQEKIRSATDIAKHQASMEIDRARNDDIVGIVRDKVDIEVRSLKNEEKKMEQVEKLTEMATRQQQVFSE